MPVRASICAVLSMVVWTSVVIAPPLTLRAQQPPFPDFQPLLRLPQQSQDRQGPGRFDRLTVARAASWPTPRATRIGRPACGARQWTTHPRHRPLRTNAPRATCPCSTSLTKLPATTPLSSPACLSTQRMKLTLRPPMVSRAPCVIKPSRQDWARADSYNGNLTTAPITQHPRPLYGPYAAEARSVSIHNLASGLTVTQSDHLGQAALCGSCHTLYTPTLDASGKTVGRLPEQMPYLEWLHSDYHDKQTCQSCHMPAIAGPAPDATLGSQPREGLRRHSFPGANFFMQDLLVAHHDELDVSASPAELTAASTETRAFFFFFLASASCYIQQITTGAPLSFVCGACSLTS